MRRTTRRSLTTTVVISAVMMLVPTAAAVNVPHSVVVSSDPANTTPHVLDGQVMAIAQIGDTVYVGGQFSQVQRAGTTQVLARNNIFAFSAASGVISTSFVPVVDNTVKALAIAPDGSIFMGGSFNTVNGQNYRRVAKLNAATGQLVTAWQANGNRAVNDLVVRGSRLFVAGEFTTLGGQPRTYLAALDVVTAAVDPNLNIPITIPFQDVSPWIRKIDVTPDGTKLVAIGNFRDANGLDRTQVFVVDLTTTPATVADWQTDRFKDLCISRFITYMKDVDFSPDGSYFVIVTTGGNRATRMCDTASRWETSAVGSGLQPTWINWAGGDSFVAVGITGTAVYVGGHFQYVNQPYVAPNCGFCQVYYPTPGAVAREGLAALDPVNGLPFTWDPGRARGEGVYAFLSTPQGLWLGSDTDRLGGEYHARLGFFSVTGGVVVPPNTPYVLPGDLYNLDADGALTRRPYDGSAIGPRFTLPTGIDWSQARGVFALGGVLYAGWSDGRLYRRSFDGSTVGSAQEIDLRGLEVAPGPDPRFVIPGTSIPIPSFSEQLQNATGMFFDGGRLYYTVQGDPRLYYRFFTPQSNVVGANIFVASGNGDGFDWSGVQGMTLADGQLYFASADGSLSRVAFASGVPSGAPTAIGGPAIDGYDWASRGLFVFGSTAPPETTPPSQPGKPVGTSTSGSSIALTWAASTDNVSSQLTYGIYRDGGATPVGTVVSSSTGTVAFTDTGLAQASTHTYTVDATDEAGNTSPMSVPSDPVTTPSALFADDFSSGSLSSWDTATGMTIDATIGGAAPPSARASVTGQAAFLREDLTSTTPTACMSAAIQMASQGANAVNLMRLRTSTGGPIVRVFSSPTRILYLRSDVASVQQSSGTSLPVGWSTVEVCGTVGTTSTWSLYLNGAPVINGWTTNSGTTPIGRVEVGDTAAKTFTMNVDDVVVDGAPG
jgi:hypothetical protein